MKPALHRTNMVLILTGLGKRVVLARGGEEFLSRTRTHIISLLWVWSAFFFPLGLLVLTLFVALVTGSYLVFLISSLISLPLFAFGIRNAAYPYHEFVITNRSIYWVYWNIVRQSSIKITEIPLESIVSTKASRLGLGRILNYGNVWLQLAVEPGVVQFKWVPNPQQFQLMVQQSSRDRIALAPITEDDIRDVNQELEKYREQRLIDAKEFEYARQSLLTHPSQ